MDLGPHAVFIWLCYAAVASAIGALIVGLWLVGRHHERELATLEAKGSGRGSGNKAS